MMSYEYIIVVYSIIFYSFILFYVCLSILNLSFKVSYIYLIVYVMRCLQARPPEWWMWLPRHIEGREYQYLPSFQAEY